MSSLKLNKAFKQSFWVWDSFHNYLFHIGMMVGVLAGMTFQFKEQIWFAQILGTLSSGVESLMPFPQFLLNCKRQSCEGLDRTLIMVWLVGDIQKLSYYLMNDSPGGLVYCAIIQTAIDVGILM